MVILKSKKNVFWEALIITTTIFILGILLGVSYEADKADQINKYVTNSEINLMDIFIESDLMNLKAINCSTMINSNIEFADKIFKEASKIEEIENAGRITEKTKIAHRRYDLLRTFLWINTIKTLEKCPQEKFSSVIYLYELETEDLVQKANQNVWSKILKDLKKEKGNKIILIPIAIDSNFTSLNSLVNRFEINSYPVVIINEKQIINQLTSLEDLNKYLN